MKKILILLGLLFISDIASATNVDLQMTKGTSTGDGDVAYPNNVVKYTLTLDVSGNLSATNVVVYDRIPTLGAGGTITYISPAGYSLTGDTISWSRGTLQAPYAETFIIKVNIGNMNVGDSFTNWASVTTGSLESAGDAQDGLKSNVASVTLTVQPPKADLYVTKSGPLEASPNEDFKYTISCKNLSGAIAKDVVITDTLPSLGSITIVSALPATSTQTGERLTWNVGNLSNGQSYNIDLYVRVNGDVPASTTLINKVEGTTTTFEDNTGNNVRIFSWPHIKSVVTKDLSLIKSSNVTEQQIGSEFQYYLTCKNLGSVSMNATITDPLPVEVDYIGTSGLVAGDSASYNSGNRTITWQVNNLSALAQRILTIRVKFNGSADANTTYFNTATLTAVDDSEPDNNVSSCGVKALQQTGADLWVTKILSTSLRNGEFATWTIKYGNNGTLQATDVKITDIYPTGLSNIGSSHPLPYDISTLNVGVEGTILVWGKVTAPEGSGMTNTTNITASEFDSNLNNNTATAYNVVEAPTADLRAIKTCLNAEVGPGGSNTFTIYVYNIGPSEAKDVTLIDKIPDQTTYNSSSAGGSYSEGTVTWNMGIISVGETKTAWVIVQVSGTAPGSSTLINTATATTTSTDQNFTNNIGTATFHIAIPDVYITKSASPTGNVSGSDTVRWTLSYGNSGALSATNIVVIDTLPNEFVYINASLAPATNTAGASYRTLGWNIGNLAPGSTGSIWIDTEVMVNATPSTYINNASITTQTAETNYNNNQISLTKTIVGADVGITSKTGPAEQNPETNFDYTINYENFGPGTATSVQITDNLPTYTTFLSSIPISTGAGNNRTWNLGTLSSDATGNISITVNLGNYPGSTTFRNYATITTANHQGDNTYQDTNYCDVHIATADVEVVSKTCDSKYQVTQGELITYLISYKNTGATAEGCELKDYLPPVGSVTFNSAQDGVSPSGNVVTWNLGNLLNGSSGTKWIKVIVNSSLKGSESFTNWASITTTSTDGNPSNNSKSRTNHVARPDVQIDKTNVEYPGDNQDVPPGAQFTYSINYSNCGEGATATGVSLYDDVDLTYVDIVSYSSGGSLAGNRITWNIGNLAHSDALQNKTIIVRLKATAVGSNTFYNRATITCTNLPEEDSGNNTDYHRNHVARPDVQIDKTNVEYPGDNQDVPPDAQFTYRINYRNYGEGATATGVSLYDDVDLTYVDIVSYSSGGSLAGNRITWNIGNLAHSDAWQNKTITVRLKVTAVGSNTFYNRATITCTNLPEEDSGNNTDYHRNHVQGYDLWITKTGPAETQQSAVITYTLSYGNNGPGTATNVQVIDILPAGVFFRQATPTMTQVGQQLTRNIGTLPNGSSGAISILIQLGPENAGSTTMINTASITATPLNDTYMTNNISILETHIQGPDPYIGKFPSYQHLSPGQAGQFTINLGNAASATAYNVKVEDNFPWTWLEFVSSIPPTSFPTATTYPLLVWEWGTMNYGSSVITINFNVRPDAPASVTVQNSITIKSTGIFSYALCAGGGDIDLESQNAKVDSYDTVPYPGYPAGNDGDIRGNGDIDMGPQGEIHGDAIPGPGDSVNEGGGTVYGSTTPSSESIVLPPVPPFDVGTQNVTSGGTINPGKYGDISLNGSDILYLNPGVYYINTLKINSNNAGIVLNGPVQLYIQGDIVIAGQGIMNNGSTGTPTDLQIYCTGTNVDIKGGAVFCGLLYAPNASVHITGTAGSPQDIFGAITANDIQCSGQVMIHRYTPAGDYSFGTYTECRQDIDDDASIAYVHIEGADVWIRKGMPTTRFELGSGTFINVGQSSITPILVDIDRDRDLDLFVGLNDGMIRYYKNIGSPSNPIFTSQGLLQAGGANIDVGEYSAPTFCDIDYDGDFDLFSGEDYSGFWFWQNTGSSTYATFTYISNSWVSESKDDGKPAFCDIDGDGDFDLFVGDAYSAGIKFYRNNGNRVTPSLNYIGLLQDSLGAPINTGGFRSVQLFDIDYDGDYDLFCGGYDGVIYFYENIGTSQNYSFTYRSNYWMGIDAGYYSVPAFGDIDGDGKVDLLVGCYKGYIEYYKNIGEELYKNASMQYNLVYGNAGNAPALNTQIQDILPANFDYWYSVPSGSLAGNTLTWNLGTLQPNFIGTIIIYGTISSTTQGSTTLINIATITTTTPECDYLPNMATYTLHIGTPTPDLAIEKIGPASWLSNFSLQYQLNYRNTVLINGLLGEYYNNYDLTGNPLYRRTDLYIDYGADRCTAMWNPWGWTSDQSFSVRWTGWLNIVSIGSRNFEINSNDTAKLSIDGTVVCQGSGLQTGSRNFTVAGWHRIELVFQEAGGAANDQYVKLRWDPAGGTNYSVIPKDVLRSIDPEELNRGGEVLNAQVQDLLPPVSSITYTSAIPIPVVSGQLLTWNLVNLNPGQEYQITINAQTANIAASNTLINTASITTTGIPGGEVGTTNNYATASTHITSSDLAIEKSLIKTPIWKTGVSLGLAGTFVDDSYCSPALGDLDRDGDLDLVVGTKTGQVYYFENKNGMWQPPVFLFTIYVGVENAYAGPYLVDIDGDGDLDMFVGGYHHRPTPYLCGNGIRFYENSTPTATVDKMWTDRGFLKYTSGATIDVGGGYMKPAFADINGDGKLDLIVGGYDGNITYIRNTGGADITTCWELVDSAWFGIDVGHHAEPEFYDIDQDGDLDMFVGEYGETAGKGNINFFENTGTPQNPIFATNPTNTWYISLANTDGNAFTAPTIGDIDKDGDPDVVIGFEEPTRNGVWFVENIAPNDVYTGQTVKYAIKYSNPSAAAIDNVQVYDWFSSSWADYALATPTATYYAGTPTRWDLGTLQPGSSGLITLVATVSYSAIASQTLVNYASITGGMSEYNYSNNLGTATEHIIGPDLAIVKNLYHIPSWELGTTAYNIQTESLSREQKPFFCDIDNDGDYDMFVGSKDGDIIFSTNTGTAQNPSWAPYTTLRHTGGIINVGAASRPCLVDIDRDGDYDLFVGDSAGYIEFYRNTGLPTFPTFSLVSDNYFELDFGDRAAPYFCDIDGDGDLDCFVGENNGTINFIKNTGTLQSPTWSITESWKSIDVGDVSIPAIFDLGQDGDWDIVIGENVGILNLLENIGTPNNPQWASLVESYIGIDTGAMSAPAFCDIDGDGDSDLFIGNDDNNSYVNFYQDIAEENDIPVGQAINYNLIYKNNSIASASGVWVYDLLPGEIIFGSATPPITGSSLVGTSTLLSWNIGSLGPYCSGVVKLYGTVSDTAIASTTITNIASITTAYSEANLTNNISTWTTHIKPPVLDLVIDKKVYRPGGLLGEYFNNSTLRGIPSLTRIDSNLDFNWYYNSPANSPGGGITGPFSVRWTGMINLLADGTYYFANYHADGDGGITDDGMRLYIDDKAVFDEYWNNDTDSCSGSLWLSKGLHRIRVEYRYRDDSARAYLWWYRPDWTAWRSLSSELLYYPTDNAEFQSGEQVVYNLTYANGTLTEGLLGEYFDNQNLSGTPVFTRIDPTVDFNWYYDGNTPEPSSSISGDFSVRWTGMINLLVDGTYYFANYHADGDGGCTDDGMRLYIDDKAVFDEYWNNDTDQTSISISLSAGWHKIQVEYRYYDDSARAYLWWYRPDWTAWRSIPSTMLFPGIEAEDTTDVSIIDLMPQGIEYATATSPPSIDTEGTYTKLTWNIGNLPKYTRNSIIVIGTVSKTLSASNTLTNYASITTTKLEATKENNIDSSAIHIASPITDLTIGKSLYIKGGLLGEYFSNQLLSGTPTLTRIDPTIDFNWSGSPPLSGPFSVRWTGMINLLADGTYYFANYHADGDGACTEDGMRLYIDDKTVFDEYWNNDTDSCYVGLLLSKGLHRIRVEYRYRDDSVRAILWWYPADISGWKQIPSSTFYYSNPSQIDVSAGGEINYLLAYGIKEQGFYGEYFSNQLLSGTPTLTRIDPTIDFNWYYNSPSNSPGGGITGPFSVRWTGMINLLADGTYYFANYHADGDGDITDDGMRLYIDDKAVFDEYWNNDTDSCYVGLLLSKGLHRIRVEYRYRDDSARAYLWWYRPDCTAWRSIGAENVIPITLPNGLLPQNVVVSDIFPSSITYSSATPSPSTFTTPSLYQWNAPNPLRGYITIAGTANSSLVGSTTFTNYASITTTTQESDYTNNAAFCTLHILGPDIWVEKTVLGTFTEALPGGTITYQIRYGNKGSITAYGVVVGDYLPKEIVGIQFSTPTSGSIDCGTATLYYWNLGTLIAGTSSMLTIRGTISETTLGSTTFTNYASITSTGGFQNIGSLTSSWSIHIPAPELYLYLYKFQPKEATFTLRSSSYANVNTSHGCVPQFADIDSDGDPDMIIDDYQGATDSPGTPHMQFLRNDGNPGFASWTTVTTDYATGTAIVEEYHDSHSFVDIDKDGDMDLFQGDGGGGYIEYYRNDGDWQTPKWVGSLTYLNVGSAELAPTFCDIDGDSDFDLFCGKSDGKIAFYRNVGSTTSPDFTGAVQENYANVSGNTNAVPTFVDIDGDGDYDLFVGNASTSKIRLYRNTGTPQNAVWAPGVDYINFGQDQGHPTFADIDADGDPDLFIGANNGRIFFYENTTEKILDAAPGEITYYLRYGNNSVCQAKGVKVYDLLPDGVTFLSASPSPDTNTGSLLTWDIKPLDIRESGTITLTVSAAGLPDSSTLVNIGTITYPGCERYEANNTGTWSNHIVSMDLSITKSIRNHPFTHITDNFEAIDVGDYSAPYLADLDGDDDDDLVVGASDKSIWFFRNDGGSFISMGSFSTGLGGRPHPCLIDENGYGTLSLFVGYDVGGGIGKIKIYKSDTPFIPSSWVSSGDFMSGENMDLKSAPTGVDIDGDGDEDLIVGNGKGAVWGYKNNGGGAWAWNWGFDMPSDDNYRVPSFFDLDFDTNLDLFCGIKNGTIEFYKNYGDQNSPIFYSAQKVDTFAGINVGNYASPAFGDVNGDKTQDLLIGRADGRLSLFRNEGSYGSEAVTGKKIAYILNCKKTGSLLVNGVVVEDLLPAGVGYDNYVIEPATMTSTFNQTENLLNWNFGNLGSSEYSWKITLIGSVTGAESNTPTNVATITPTSDVILTNNYSSVTSHIIELVSDVWVSKRHLEWGTNSPPSEVPAGGYINYVIEYGNIGLLTAPDVKIVDTIPSGTTYLSSDKSCTVNIVGTLTYVKWDLESLPPLSGTRTINFKVQVGLEVATGTILLNIASITTGEADKSLENNLSTWTTIVKVPVIDLVIIKTGPATVTVGGDVLYVLTFWNAGTATLHNVKAYDYFGQSMNENNLTYQGLGSGAGSVSVVEAGYLLTLTIGTLTPDLSIVLEVKFKLSKNAIMGQSIINIASITYTGDAGIETQLENNYSSWITFIGTPSVALKIWILPMEGTGTSGYERRYSLILYNAGNVESGATITVTLPQDYLTYLSTGTTNVIQEKGSPATWVSPSAQYSTYTIGPYYDESSRKLWWIIDAQRESPDVYDTSPYVYATSTLIEKGEPSRYTLGHCYTKGTDTGWGGLGMPKTWDKLKNFLNGSTIALFPLYTFNTKVGSVSQATTITLTAEIEPMPMKTFDIMEISGGSHTLTDTITTMAIQSAGKSKSLGIQSTALTMRSTPHELYVGKGGFIFYQIESAVRPRLLLDTKDIDFRNSFPLNEPLMISTNTYLFWVKVAATETGTHIENIVGSEKTSHYLDSRPPAVDISSITQDCLINWKGTDPNLAPLAPQISGSGICRYTLYYKEGDSAWKPYGSYPSSSSSVTFAGKNGGRYEFYLEAVDIVGNRARSPINGLTISIMGTAADHLGDVIVWPNPYRADKHSQLNFGGCSDPIRNLTADAKIRVFNIKGELVKEKEVYPPSEGVWRWINPEREVASGVYIYVITNQAGEKHIGKLAIIK